MNINEECLLQFLNNPERLNLTTKELKKFIFSSNDIIINNNGINLNNTMTVPFKSNQH